MEALWREEEEEGEQEWGTRLWARTALEADVRPDEQEGQRRGYLGGTPTWTTCSVGPSLELSTTQHSLLP